MNFIDTIAIETVLAEVKELAQNVGQLQKLNFGRKDLEINTKSSGIDLVTEIDKKSEKIILAYIKKRFPSHAVLAEESGLMTTDSDYLWIVDPLDGTTNYAQGLPIFAVSIALRYQKEIILGVVYTPMTDELFTAVRGQGAYLNGQKIAVSTKHELLQSTLATGFPYDIADNPLNNVDYFSSLLLQTRAIRRMGSAAYDLACVAAGRFDGFWEMNLSPWDVSAAMLMVKEAGGQIIPFRDDRGISIIAGNSVICQKIHQEIQNVDRKIKNQ